MNLLAMTYLVQDLGNVGPSSSSVTLVNSVDSPARRLSADVIESGLPAPKAGDDDDALYLAGLPPNGGSHSLL